MDDRMAFARTYCCPRVMTTCACHSPKGPGLDDRSCSHLFTKHLLIPWLCPAEQRDPLSHLHWGLTRAAFCAHEPPEVRRDSTLWTVPACFSLEGGQSDERPAPAGKEGSGARQVAERSRGISHLNPIPTALRRHQGTFWGSCGFVGRIMGLEEDAGVVGMLQMKKGGMWRPGPPSELSSGVEALATRVSAAPRENRPGLSTQPSEADKSTVSAPGTALAAHSENPVFP